MYKLVELVNVNRLMLMCVTGRYKLTCSMCSKIKIKPNNSYLIFFVIPFNVNSKGLCAKTNCYFN